MYFIMLVNTLRPRQSCRHFADDIFKWIFLNRNVWIFIEISLTFVPKGQINNILVLDQIMLGTDQATSHYLNQWWYSLLIHICITRPQWVKHLNMLCWEPAVLQCTVLAKDHISSVRMKSIEKSSSFVCLFFFPEQKDGNMTTYQWFRTNKL